MATKKIPIEMIQSNFFLHGVYFQLSQFCFVFILHISQVPYEDLILNYFSEVFVLKTADFLSRNRLWKK